MATRPYWKGYLKLSLVTCPVQVMPATTENEKVRFHTLNRSTKNRVVSQYVDSVTGKPVKEDDEVRGYPRGEDDYVMLEDDELENVALDSTRTIDISTFTSRDSIEWIWPDTPYYLSPNDKVGEEAFSVIRGAMEAQKMVGISRLVISRRERAVMLEPRDKGIVLWTLRYGDEVRDEEGYFADIGNEKADSEMMPLIQKLIILDLGHEVVGPAMRLETALEAVETENLDFAILDINLAGKQSFPVADLLADRGIPFIFASGYGAAGLNDRHRAATVVQKPFAADQIASHLSLL